MCRTGGRRCPGHDAPAGRAAHNARRRRNREIKAAIIDEAVRRGAQAEVVEQLRKGSPEQAKQWAQANQLPSHVHPGRGHTDPELRPLAADEPGVPSDLHDEVRQARREIRQWMDEGEQRQHRGGAGRGQGAGAPKRPVPPPAPQPVAPVTGEWSTPGLDRQISHTVLSQGEHREEKNLLGGEVAEHRLVAEGTNQTSRVMLSNGVAGFHKPFEDLDHDLADDFGHDSAQQCIHEVAAWRVASKMGEPYQSLVPPVVLREVNGKMGSFAMERPGKPLGSPRECPEWRDAAFFDAFIGQQDRHQGNYLRAGDRLTLIDHGYSFGRPGDMLNWTDFLTERTREVEKGRDPQAMLLSGREVDVLDRFLGDESRFGLQGVIEPDRLEAMVARARTMRQSGRLPVYGGATSSTETSAHRKRWSAIARGMERL